MAEHCNIFGTISFAGRSVFQLNLWSHSTIVYVAHAFIYLLFVRFLEDKCLVGMVLSTNLTSYMSVGE
jgi:hypothetical protein